MEGSCYIFGAGQATRPLPRIQAADLVIAADGGYAYAIEAGLRVDVLIGDFDSLSALPPEGPLVRRLPKEKDETDMLAAIQYGLEKDFSRFHIYGGTGGEIDHTLANIQCLLYLAKRGARGYLYGSGCMITALRGEVWLAPQESGTISLFAIGGGASGVCLRGLQYELEDATLQPDFPLGARNACIGKPVYIRVADGILGMVCPIGTKELTKAQ